MWDAYRLACRIIEEKDIDVITTWGCDWIGLIQIILRKKYKIPINVQLHWEFVSNPYFKRERIEYRLWDAVGRYVLPRADTYFVGTSKEKMDLIKYGIDEDRIFHTPFTILTDKFEVGCPARIRSELKLKGFDNVLLWVGRLVKQKDIVTLLKAAALVFKKKPNTALVLLGDGPERKLVERTIHDLQIADSIIMPGFLSQQECINYYHSADVVCMSSLYEGTCRTFLEGMAAAKPIVTTDVAGAFDAVIEGKTGYVVAKKHSENMAQAILKLLNNPVMAKEMGQAGKELLHQQFTMERHYKGFINMWNETKRLGIKQR
jgi:glycosyltransferase involved in cell wall biosynthesis